MSSQSWGSVNDGKTEDMEGQGQVALAELAQENVQISAVNPFTEGCHCIGWKRH